MIKIYAFIIAGIITLAGVAAAVNAMGLALDQQEQLNQQATAFVAHAQAQAQAGR